MSQRAEKLLNFHKFPRTPHLIDLGSATEDDLVINEDLGVQFLSSSENLSIEEKIDGANVGFSLSETEEIVTQNRSHYVNSKSHPQFQKLSSWIFQHHDSLLNILSSSQSIHRHSLILFGEWLFAKHSIHYNSLPDYFIAFDIFDVQEQKFYSRRRFYELLEGSSISFVRPVLNVLSTDSFSLNVSYFNSTFFPSFSTPSQSISSSIEEDTNPSSTMMTANITPSIELSPLSNTSLPISSLTKPFLLSLLQLPSQYSRLEYPSLSHLSSSSSSTSFSTSTSNSSSSSSELHLSDQTSEPKIPISMERDRESRRKKGDKNKDSQRGSERKLQEMKGKLPEEKQIALKESREEEEEEEAHRERIEGLYIRIDEEGPNPMWLKERAKIVRGDFICGNEHWSKHHIQQNRVQNDVVQFK